MPNRYRPAAMTRAARMFDAEIKSRAQTNAQVATLLGCSNVVARWRNGERIPSVDFAIKIRNVYGVPIEFWGVPADQAA